MNIIDLLREEVVEAIAATKQVIGEYRGELEQTGGCAFCIFAYKRDANCFYCPLYIATGYGCGGICKGGGFAENIPKSFPNRSASERQIYTQEFDARADYLEHVVLEYFEDRLAEMETADKT